jgi:signal peptidase
MPDIPLKSIIYTGPSMNPTLKAGDKLYVTPYDGQKIRPGDVIVFLSPESGRKVTHRIISADSHGIRTRGDNNSKIDPWILSPDKILGRVGYAKKINRWRRICGGEIGQLYGLMLKAIHLIDSSISPIFRPAYQWLSKSGILTRYVLIQKKIRVLSYKRPGGNEFQLLLGKYLIGRCPPGKNKWDIRRPFRLFINEASLPQRNPHRSSAQESRKLHSDKKIKEKKGENTGLIKQIRDIHTELTLCGEPRNALLSLPYEFLVYIFSILKNKPIKPPKASIKQWSEFLDLLKPHWILPLLYKHISSWPQKFHPPEEIMHRMRKPFLMSRARALQMEKQLSEIINAFHKEGVQVLVLKGPALALTVYPDPAMRASSDLDLLVLPTQMAQARAILEHLDYKCLGKRFEHSKDFYCEETFIHTSKPRYHRAIELHWDLHSFSGISRDAALEDLFLRAAKVKSSALNFDTLNPVDSLLHRAINMSIWHNKAIRLIWIYDTALLARELSSPDEWKALQERSIAWRARLALENSLKMAQVWVGLKMPGGFNDFSTWPRPTQIEASFWSDALLRHEQASSFFKLHWSSSSGIFQKARFLFHLLFPHPEIIRKYYPTTKKWLLPFTYIRRLYLWIMKLIVTPIFSSKQRR